VQDTLTPMSVNRTNTTELTVNIVELNCSNVCYIALQALTALFDGTLVV